MLRTSFGLCLRFGWVALIAGACVGCGSGEDSFARRYSVSGTVTYNDQPLAHGIISFVPDSGAGATGTITDGSYTLSTGSNGDGALPGRYKVTVSAKEDTEALAKAQYAKEFKKTEAQITAIPRQYLANAASKAKNLVPAGYGDVRSTTLTAEVKTSSNTIPFALSDKDAPPAPPQEPARKGRR